MPSASRNANRKRRARRNVSLLKRAVQSEALSRVKTTVVTFAILNKLGGEIELSKRDLDTAAVNMTKLSFVVEPSALEGNFMVRLVALTEPGSEIPNEAIQQDSQPVETASDPSPSTPASESAPAVEQPAPVDPPVVEAGV